MNLELRVLDRRQVSEFSIYKWRLKWWVWEKDDADEKSTKAEMENTICNGWTKDEERMRLRKNVGEVA